MIKYVQYIGGSLVVALALLTILYITEYSNENFMIKAALFGGFGIVFVAVMFRISKEWLPYPLILMSFLNISIKQYHTTSTNLLIAVAVGIIFFRQCVEDGYRSVYRRIAGNSCTVPILAVLGSYTASLAFVKKDYAEQFMAYHSFICAVILTMMIVGTVSERKHLHNLNIVLLIGLLMNLGFSAASLVAPQLDAIRADIFSLVMTEETAYRLPGLSFRGEAYGEYLMICGLWLFTMLVRNQFVKGRLLLWLILGGTILALIMNMARGANAIFLAGALFVLLTSKTIPLHRKALSLFCVALLFIVAAVALKATSRGENLLDRFGEFSDTSTNVGYIPATRYYTWMPSLQLAKKNKYLGLGPSYKPYIDEGLEWKDLVNDQASGDVVTWPHNITILVLCTIGVYGLLSYLFLLYRALRLRLVFHKLDNYLRNSYSSYLLCLIAFLLEAQKYDGMLREPTCSLYVIFILLGALFSCEGIANAGEFDDEGAGERRASQSTA